MAIFFAISRLRLLSLLKKDSNAEVSFKTMGFKMHARGYSNLNSLLIEVFLNGEYLFRSTDPNPLIVDGGSNIGISVLFFKYLYPDSTILAFEPNPVSCEILRRNIADNGLKDVEVFEYALSGNEGDSVLYFGNETASFTASLSESRGGKNTTAVQCKPLSSFLADREKIHLMKLDVEGAESEVLQELASSKTLDRVEHILLEFHHNFPEGGPKLSVVAELLTDNGFIFGLTCASSHPTRFQDIFIEAVKKA